MKAIMIMFDSLNRGVLPPYGCQWVHAPNFQRLAEKTVVFEKSFAGSLPCLSARRELHTGRYNFLHRSYGPLEPFDDSMPAILRCYGVETHLISDFNGYSEEGGSSYAQCYSHWEMVRGGKAHSGKGDTSELAGFSRGKEDENDSQATAFALGIDYIERHFQEDKWFLQIETNASSMRFPAPQRYRDLYPLIAHAPPLEWPSCARIENAPGQAEHIQNEYAAFISKSDVHLGEVLDTMDRLNLWKDTLLIINADHGFLLGGHGWWGRSIMPFYSEVARTPLFVWDPRVNKRNEVRQALVQTIDLAPTVLEFFRVPIPSDMQGVALKDTVAADVAVRRAALFGVFGAHVSCTDGRYLYMRAPMRPENEPLYQYTQVGTAVAANERCALMMREPFAFTKGGPVMKILADGRAWVGAFEQESLLFDLQEDPNQAAPIYSPEIEDMMIRYMTDLMWRNDAPEEQYEMLGLTDAAYHVAVPPLKPARPPRKKRTRRSLSRKKK